MEIRFKLAISTTLALPQSLKLVANPFQSFYAILVTAHQMDMGENITSFTEVIRLYNTINMQIKNKSPQNYIYLIKVMTEPVVVRYTIITVTAENSLKLLKE